MWLTYGSGMCETAHKTLNIAPNCCYERLQGRELQEVHSQRFANVEWSEVGRERLSLGEYEQYIEIAEGKAEEQEAGVPSNSILLKKDATLTHL